MGLADLVWRAHAKYATAVFATAVSYGFLYTVVNGSTPLDDARARWAGEPSMPQRAVGLVGSLADARVAPCHVCQMGQFFETSRLLTV